MLLWTCSSADTHVGCAGRASVHPSTCPVCTLPDGHVSDSTRPCRSVLRWNVALIRYGVGVAEYVPRVEPVS